MSKGRDFFTEFQQSLEKVDKQGAHFAITGIAEHLPKIPLLHVNDMIEPVTLPISPSQISELVEIASAAKFGKGSDTVLDRDVRDGFTIPGRDCVFNNPSWNKHLKALTSHVQKSLGVVKNIHCELHDLLIYPPGGHFKKHRDSEKTQGMFGTLIISLPSEHTGGIFQVSHENQTLTFDTSVTSSLDLLHMKYCAFYADCEHEVLPVESGHRVVLTYNLIQKSKKDNMPSPPSQQLAASAIQEFAQRWVNNPEYFSSAVPNKLCYFLEHSYTDAQCGWSDLKGADSTMIDALVQSNVFDLFLVSVTNTENGDDDSGDIGDQEIEYTNWKPFDDLQGLPPQRILDMIHKKRSYEVESEEWVQGEDYFYDEDADQSEHEGFTGNEGAPYTRWYHRMAVVAWPKNRRVAMMGFSSSVNSLVDAQGGDEDALVGYENITALAKACVDEVRCNDPPAASQLIRCLAHSSIQQDSDLLRRFLKSISLADLPAEQDFPGGLLQTLLSGKKAEEAVLLTKLRQGEGQVDEETKATKKQKL